MEGTDFHHYGSCSKMSSWVPQSIPISCFTKAYGSIHVHINVFNHLVNQVVVWLVKILNGEQCMLSRSDCNEQLYTFCTLLWNWSGTDGTTVYRWSNLKMWTKFWKHLRSAMRVFWLHIRLYCTLPVKLQLEKNIPQCQLCNQIIKSQMYWLEIGLHTWVNCAEQIKLHLFIQEF